MDELLLRRRMLNKFRDDYIVFEDSEAERVCATNWGDGTHITKRDAALVTADQFKTAFVNNTTVVNFNEFQYFTGITAMAGNASQWFSGCTALKKIALPAKLVTMNNNNVTGGIFKNCTSLEEITLPETLTKIGNNTFYHSTASPFSANMTKINVPSVEFYGRLVLNNTGSSPFYNSSAATRGIYVNGNLITHMVVPEGVTSLSAGFLYKNNTITEITIPTTLTSTAAKCFSGASGIAKVNISNLEKFLQISWSTDNGCPYIAHTAGGPLYLNGTQVTSITIPSSVTTLKAYALYRVKQITSVSLHNSITSIGASSLCSTNITSINIPSSVTTVGNDAFSYCYQLPSITIPATVTSCGTEVCNYCTGLIDFYDYRSGANTRDAANYTNTTVGNGTGTMYFDKNCTHNASTAGAQYFRKLIFKGNLAMQGGFNIQNNTYGTCIEEIRVGGNLSCTRTGTNYYSLVQVNNSQISKASQLKFIEVMGTITAQRPFFVNRAIDVADGCIYHFGYNGIAISNPAMCVANGSRISKIYVGDGSSQAADQAVLDQYLADSSWSSYASKLDLWYNYTGTYKTS